MNGPKVVKTLFDKVQFEVNWQSLSGSKKKSAKTEERTICFPKLTSVITEPQLFQGQLHTFISTSVDESNKINRSYKS